MPELPEVEVLARHLRAVLPGRKVRGVTVRRAKVLGKTTLSQLSDQLAGKTFRSVNRRGKYLVFKLGAGRTPEVTLIGHLGMTGRMYLQRATAPLPKHAAVVLRLDRDENFVFEDTRYFGRFTLDTSAISQLGPEPLSNDFSVERFAGDLQRSSQAIKVKLLDQAMVAGIGNIYASEALHRAGLSPTRAARSLTFAEARRLRRAIRTVLRSAIRGGSTVALVYGGSEKSDGLFYFGSDGESTYEERLRVYDRAGKACRRCRTPIRRLVQAARSTFYCPKCQPG
jgi:formamidopyrimidine-DNA glycosylase